MLSGAESSFRAHPGCFVILIPAVAARRAKSHHMGGTPGGDPVDRSDVEGTDACFEAKDTCCGLGFTVLGAFVVMSGSEWVKGGGERGLAREGTIAETMVCACDRYCWCLTTCLSEVSAEWCSTALIIWWLHRSRTCGTRHPHTLDMDSSSKTPALVYKVGSSRIRYTDGNPTGALGTATVSFRH